MMNLDPKNEIILNKALGVYREVYKFGLPSYEITFDDHGDCRYKMSHHLETSEFWLSFYCRSFDSVFQVDGKNFIKEKYPGSHAYLFIKIIIE